MTESADARQVTGAEKPAESDDPMTLSGAYVPGALDAMCEASVMEFAQMGMASKKIFKLFESPFYAATHRFYSLRGEAATRAMIARVLERTPTIRYKIEIPERNCCQTGEEIKDV